MSPERMTDLVGRWVRRYTRDLPPGAAERRIGEIDADLHDHVAHERAQGTPDRRIALSIAGRMLRGLPADASWRRAVARTSTRKETNMSKRTSRSVLRVALVTAAILLIPAVGMVAKADGTNWSAFDFVLAAVLLMGAGLLLETALRHPRSLVVRGLAGLLGVAAMVLGEMDDAPGLVGFGLLLIGGTVALTVRARTT